MLLFYPLTRAHVTWHILSFVTYTKFILIHGELLQVSQSKHKSQKITRLFFNGPCWTFKIKFQTKGWPHDNFKPNLLCYVHREWNLILVLTNFQFCSLHWQLSNSVAHCASGFVAVLLIMWTHCLIWKILPPFILVFLSVCWGQNVHLSHCREYVSMFLNISNHLLLSWQHMYLSSVYRKIDSHQEDLRQCRKWEWQSVEYQQ